jgi:putative transposase
VIWFGWTWKREANSTTVCSILHGQIRRQLGPVFKELARHKESKIIEGRLVGDNVHMLISIPPAYEVAHVVRYMKGKRAIWLARLSDHRKNFTGHNFWARGYL